MSRTTKSEPEKTTSSDGTPPERSSSGWANPEGEWEDGLVTREHSPVFIKKFRSKLRKDQDLPEECSKLVQIDVPDGLVDMFGRLYPEQMWAWVHHFDDYGVIVEGTYEVGLARRALKKAGYKHVRLWGYRPILLNRKASSWPYGLSVGGRSAVAFYFEVSVSG